MKLRSILPAAALLLASVPFLSAKTYDVHLSGPAMAGTIQLPAGDYHLKVDADQATFTMLTEKSKTFTAPVKMETAPQKFDSTAVVSTTSDGGGAARIEAIELGGSTTRLEFK